MVDDTWKGIEKIAVSQQGDRTRTVLISLAPAYCCWGSYDGCGPADEIICQLCRDYSMDKIGQKFKSKKA
jgi:hypothetical protein